MAISTTQPRADLDLEHFRTILEAERTRLVDQIRRIEEQLRTGGPAGETGELAAYDQHAADQATETFLRGQDAAIERGLRAELGQVELSFKKMQAGEYGYCDRCGTEIPAERLEVLPFAIYCLDCADEMS
jgi:RNA polymerase-binding protein DksA